MKKPHVGPPVGATAIVTLTVEVRASGSWGNDCSVAQVHRQAAEEATGYLNNLVRIQGNNRLTIVSKPEVRTIIVERK